jgi:hypothetical protein
MKKTILLSLLILLFFSFTNSFVLADKSPVDCSKVPTGGLVPCGRICDDPNTSKNETNPCQLCDIFTLINNIVHLLLFEIIPIIAALLIAVGGIMMIWAYAGSGGPAMLVKAKTLFTSVVIGLLIIYCAWLIVNMFFWAIGVSEWEGLKTWWVIKC